MSFSVWRVNQNGGWRYFETDTSPVTRIIVARDTVACGVYRHSLKFRFKLKGGTSLSKDFGVIHRFSEDIDIRIEPPDGLQVKVGRNHDKPTHCRHFSCLSLILPCAVESPSPAQFSLESNTHPHLKSIFLIFIKLTHVIERIFRQLVYFC